jgi:HAD superfamily hydrolase (TIGR01549 family)
MKQQGLIFDFDGTIADSLPVIVKVYHELMPDRPELTTKDFHRLRSLPARQVAKELGISWWKAPFLLTKGRSRMYKYMPEVKVFAGIPEVLRQLTERGYKLQIVSSNSSKNVAKFLETHGLSDYFVGIHGKAGAFSKVKALKKILKSANLVAGETYYVGDEVKDSVAAHAVGMPNVAVTWGFNDKGSLAATQPTHLVDTPKDLLTLFK